MKNISNFKKIIILCAWVFCLYVCLHITFTSGAHGGEKGMSNTLELRLQTVVGHHVDVEN